MKEASAHHPRPPQRIDRIIPLLEEAWRLCPDFRLTQLVMGVADELEDLGRLFAREDHVFEKQLIHFIASMKQIRSPQTDAGPSSSAE